MRPGIDDNDYSHKIKHAKDFLEKGDKVKITMMFRGREIVYADLGRKVMDQIQEDLQGCAVVEKRPLIEGKSMTMLLSPGVSQASKVKKAENNEKEDENNA